jgi:hypothetical protein
LAGQLHWPRSKAGPPQETLATNDQQFLNRLAQTGCVPKFSQRTDRVAIAVFEQAQQIGEPVTMPLVNRVIAELGEAASPQLVYQAAVIWERSVSATRRRARA